MKEIKENESHIVLMVGTNNLKSDETKMITNKYKSLVNELKEKRFQRISIAEILASNDISNYITVRG